MSTNQQNLIGIDNLGVEHIPKEIIKFIEQKGIITNFYRIRPYDSIMCGLDLLILC